MSFLILFTIPALIIFINKYFYKRKEVSLKENLLQFGIQAAMCGILVAVFYGSNVHDVEILNGRTTDKARVRVSCSHSYDCYCTTDKDGHRSCSTCYRHSHDYSWRLYTTVGTINISRVDSQGLREPERWTRAKKGEAVALASSYTNYRKGSADILYPNKELLEKYKNELPKYPSNIYDYHRLNRLVRVGKINYNFSGWNKELEEINAELGSLKEVNMVLVITRDKHPEYFNALEHHWLGGKKNDAILVIDVDGDNKINWVKAMALTQDRKFQSSIADVIQGEDYLSDNILKTFRAEVEKRYHRKPMSEFAYLKDSIKPSSTQLIIGFILSFIIALIGCHIVNKNYERNYY